MFPDPKRLRIGCSGWSYADWVGPFYPKDAKPGDYLRLYSTIFDAVEIDSTYYRTTSPSPGQRTNTLVRRQRQPATSPISEWSATGQSPTSARHRKTRHRP